MSKGLSKPKRINSVYLWVKSKQGKYFCHCGCNKPIIIKRYHRWRPGGIPKYRNWHSPNRGFKRGSNPWNKGIKTGLIPKSAFKPGFAPWNKDRPGEINSNWQGGISRKPYSLEWSESLRRRIRDIDRHMCKSCGIREINLHGFHKKLDVHHIDYNKENCRETNLISVCHSCNIIANYTRDYWYAFYTYKVAERAGV